MSESFWDWAIVIVCSLIAWHGLTYRGKDGERPWVHLLFGSIALLFSVRTLFVDILHLVTF